MKINLLFVLKITKIIIPSLSQFPLKTNPLYKSLLLILLFLLENLIFQK